MHEIHTVLEWLAVAIDLVASLIMVWGFVIAIGGLITSSFKAGGAHDGSRRLQILRCELGMKVVFALEMMIIADLLHTVISRTVDDLLLVGGLVIIRTTVAFFLNKEIQEIGAELGKSNSND